MISFRTGDMFDTDAEIRVNTVNCVGVMGKGIALEFKTRYPEMFAAYQRACRNEGVQPGKLHIWKSFDTTVVNFPTKRHWRDDSRYEDIRDGLLALRSYLQGVRPCRVTIPALGCGNGGLDWNKVSEMITSHLGDLPHDIMVFNPDSNRLECCRLGTIVCALQKGKRVAITGHRPDKLPDRITGYDSQNPLRTALRARLEEILSGLGVSYGISGMALGADQDFVEVCGNVGIPWVAAIPFRGQEGKWPYAARLRYQELLSKAREVHYIHPLGYAAWKMMARNKWMVDHADVVVAIWDGSGGGTSNCVEYAQQKGVEIVRIDPGKLV